jgi:hypothetical protein
VNLYGFVANDPNNNFDALGRALTPYTIDTSTLPLEEKDMDGTTIGQHDANAWPNVVAKASGTCVTVEGSLTIKLFVKTGRSPKSRGKDGLTVEDHEREHAAITKLYWSSNKLHVDDWEGSYCSEDCASLAAMIANTQNLVIKYRQIVNNNNFDVTQYGSESGADTAEEFQHRLDEELNRLADETGAFEKKGCKKPTKNGSSGCNPR